MGIVKKYARAAISSNLKCDEGHQDVNALMAVALCGVPLGPLLLRAKLANDIGSIYELKRAWLDVCAKAAFMQGWPENIKTAKVMNASLEYWLNDTCPECTGRKSDLIDNTPCLSGVECAACQGSGKRPLPVSVIYEPFVTRMINALDATSLSARTAASGKLKEED